MTGPTPCLEKVCAECRENVMFYFNFHLFSGDFAILGVGPVKKKSPCISLSFRFEAAGSVHVHVEEENAKVEKEMGWLRWILSFFF